MERIQTKERLREIMGHPLPIVPKKIHRQLNAKAIEFIQKSPLMFISTSDLKGRSTVAPKGDPAGFVQIVGSTTLRIPERKGNRLLMSLQLRRACAEKITTAKTLISHDWRCTIDHVVSVWRLLRPFKYQIFLALGIGVTIGVGVWYGGPWIGAVASGIGGFATALSVQAGLWVRKLFAGDAEQIA